MSRGSGSWNFDRLRQCAVYGRAVSRNEAERGTMYVMCGVRGGAYYGRLKTGLFSLDPRRSAPSATELLAIGTVSGSLTDQWADRSMERLISGRPGCSHQARSPGLGSLPWVLLMSAGHSFGSSFPIEEVTDSLTLISAYDLR